MSATASALVFTALALASHSRSEGRSTFLVDEHGRVSIEIILSEADMPDLCDINLAVADPALREERERLLAACLERDLPTLLRVRERDDRNPNAPDAPCPVVMERSEAKNAVVNITAHAACPTFPRQLVVDWGLFASTALDHVNIAKIEQPFADPKLVMLSRRASKLVVDVERPLWLRYGLAAAAVAAVGVILVIMRLVIRRQSRPSKKSDR